MTTSFSAGRWRTSAPYVVIVSMVALSLALSIQLRESAGNLRRVERELHRRKTMPMPGMFVPTVRAVTEAGDSVLIGETQSGRAQVFMYFSTTCEFCLQNLPTWRAISDSLLRDPERKYDVFWVSVSGSDSVRQYVAKHGLPYPVVRMPHWKINRLLRVNGVPLTIVSDQNGRIIHVHPSIFHNRSEIDSIYSAASAVIASASANPPKVDPRATP